MSSIFTSSVTALLYRITCYIRLCCDYTSLAQMCHEYSRPCGWISRQKQVTGSGGFGALCMRNDRCFWNTAVRIVITLECCYWCCSIVHKYSWWLSPNPPSFSYLCHIYYSYITKWIITVALSKYIFRNIIAFCQLFHFMRNWIVYKCRLVEYGEGLNQRMEKNNPTSTCN